MYLAVQSRSPLPYMLLLPHISPSCGLMASPLVSYLKHMSFVKSIPINLTDGRLLSVTALGIGSSIWLWSSLRRKNNTPICTQPSDTTKTTQHYNTSNDTSATMVLPDGRTLGYAQYGATTGRPIFFLHGLATTRIDAAVWDDTARELNVRLIAPDRPGTGWSSPQPGRTLLDYPKDIEQLAAHLKLEKYGLMVSLRLDSDTSSSLTSHYDSVNTFTPSILIQSRGSPAAAPLPSLAPTLSPPPTSSPSP